MNLLFFLVATAFVILLGGVFIALLAYPLAWAWNTMVTPTFGLPTIGWIEAVAAQVLLIFVRGMPVKVDGLKK